MDSERVGYFWVVVLVFLVLWDYLRVVGGTFGCDNGVTVVTPQTQKSSKHEKCIPKVLVNFSFLIIQSKQFIQSTNIKNFHNNFIKNTPKVSQNSMQ